MSASNAADLDERLFRLLQLVNDWLKFAEAKNVGMVGLASAALGFLLGYVASNVGNFSFLSGVAIALGSLALILALLANLTSFLPQTDTERALAARLPSSRDTDNLYYYGHVARHHPRSLVEAIARRHLGGDADPIDDGHLDLAAQIITNGRITLRKLRIFSFSIVCFGFGVVACAAGVFLAAFTQ